MSATGATVRPAHDADAAAAADLHVSQISDGFLTVLGPRFLRRLYRRINRAEDSFLLVVDHQDRPMGFIAGSMDVKALYRDFLWRDGIRAALPAAGRILRQWRRVRETLGHGSGQEAGVGRGAELLAVAVDPTWHGQGAGGLLVASFLEEVGARGGRAAHVVVGETNAVAVALYGKAGFVVAERFELHPGTVSLLMQWDRTNRRDAV